MSDSSDIDAIREQKLEELKQSLGEGAGETDNSADAAPGEPIHITDASHLQEVVQRYPVVFADFYADWCGPCKMLEPIVEQLAAESDAAVVKIDVDAQQQLAMEYSVRGVPTVVLFADGSPAERLSGVRDKSFYEQLIAQHTN